VELSSDQSNKIHVDTRCEKALKAMAIIKSKGLAEKLIHALTKSQLYKSFIMPILTYGIELVTLSKKEFNQMRITESNIIKNLLNVRSSCRTKPIMDALRIETLARRITKMKLSLFVRLSENEYTKLVIDETKAENTELDFIKEVDQETSDFSTALDIKNKCNLKLETISHASNMEWKNNTIASQLLKIFENIDREKISGLITSLTATYQPCFLVM